MPSDPPPPSAPLRRVCVFCASSPGSDPEITDATVALGRLLVERDIELVYGGGAVGLMGLIADTVMEAGGRVTGVIPSGLFSKEVGHQGLTRLEEVDSMHTRKARMYELSDAFIALPGGFGTLEELAETLTWNQIGILAKPVGVLDVGGFWQPLLALFDAMVDATILKEKNRSLLLDDPDPANLLDRLATQEMAYEPKWIGDDVT
ncbi:MAG: TIGR00730 family Rossman fold protein [Actinomycetota bacterium]